MMTLLNLKFLWILKNDPSIHSLFHDLDNVTICGFDDLIMIKYAKLKPCWINDSQIFGKGRLPFCTFLKLFCDVITQKQCAVFRNLFVTMKATFHCIFNLHVVYSIVLRRILTCHFSPSLLSYYRKCLKNVCNTE